MRDAAAKALRSWSYPAGAFDQMLCQTEGNRPVNPDEWPDAYCRFSGSGEVAESWPAGDVNFVFRNNLAGGLGSGRPDGPERGFVLTPPRSASDCFALSEPGGCAPFFERRFVRSTSPERGQHQKEEKTGECHGVESLGRRWNDAQSSGFLFDVTGRRIWFGSTPTSTPSLRTSSNCDNLAPSNPNGDPDKG